MNRLRDESGLDPISEKGIEMLRAVRPTASSPLMKRRVWAALQESTMATPVRQRSSMLRVLVVGVGLVAFTATAAATMGGRRIAARIEKLWASRVGTGIGAAPPRPERTKPVRVVGTTTRTTHGRLPPGGRVAPPPPPPPAPPPPPEVAAAEASAKLETRTPVAALPPAHGALRAARPAPLAAETTRERAQVWEALVALRRDHDPNRAAALLSHELEANPRGVLRQEALVLAIEAADARGDRRGAESFARTYQAAGATVPRREERPPAGSPFESVASLVGGGGEAHRPGEMAHRRPAGRPLNGSKMTSAGRFREPI